MNINSKAKLNNGVEMPLLGLGVWQVIGTNAQDSVEWAIRSGYRHIDTAAIYGNEREVSRAIKKSGVPRNEIFITTKLWNDDHDNVEKALELSLANLATDYVDLYLMHWPVEGKRIDSWKIMEKLHKKGKCKAIGVSNFTIRHLEELLKNSEIVPAINQVEFNPYLYQKELLEYCRKKGIQLEAYSPLAQGKRLADPKLIEMENKYMGSPAQIMIRWTLQHDLVVIPRSKNKDRIIENSRVFDFSITEDDMERLNAFNKNYRFCWDPTNVP